MTERSYYWDGSTTGDAVLAKYNEFVYHDIWHKLFAGNAANYGVICGYENELEVVGVSGGVTVDTGAALVDGQFYENDEKLTIAIPTPSGATRIDQIGLSRDPTTQTIRAIRIAGVEGGGAPTYTKITNGLWQISLGRVTITTAGVITVIDTRECIQTPMSTPFGRWEIIEEILTVGNEETVTFSSIPQTFRHLYLTSVGQLSENGGSSGVVYSLVPIVGYLNGNEAAASYNIQALEDLDTGLAAPLLNSAGGAGVLGGMATFPTGAPFGYQGTGKVWIPYYSNTNFFKALLFITGGFNPNANGTVGVEGGMGKLTTLFESTSGISSIKLASPAYYDGVTEDSYFLTNCKFTLYGID